MNPIRERANALENQTLLPRIFDLEREEYVPIPNKGDVHKQNDGGSRRFTPRSRCRQCATQDGRKDITSLLSQLGKHRKTEITDKVAQKYIDEGVAEQN